MPTRVSHSLLRRLSIVVTNAGDSAARLQDEVGTLGVCATALSTHSVSLKQRLFSDIGKTTTRFARSELVQKFLIDFEQTARSYESWANSTSSDLESSSEALETLICRKAQNELFREEAYDQEKDSELQQAYENYSDFIQPRHLELSSDVCQDCDIQVAVAQLQRVSEYFSPRDKLVCISNCYRVVSQIIQSTTNEYGADVTLPLFTYVVLKAKVPLLYRTYYFIKSFRLKSRREARDPVEFRYTLTTLKITLNFITEMSMEKLKLESGEVLPGFRRECKTVDVQTDEQSDVKPTIPQYPGPLETGFLRSNPSSLIQLLTEFVSLRTFYRQRLIS